MSVGESLSTPQEVDHPEQGASPIDVDFFREAELPTNRQAIRGVLADGREIWIVRNYALQVYDCGGSDCGEAIEITSEHSIVRLLEHDDDEPDHQHWHSTCMYEELLPTLTEATVRPVRDADISRPKRRPHTEYGRGKKF